MEAAVTTLPKGFRLGHWQDMHAVTGCTVVLCPPSTVGGCDVRGSSPGSRELALLASERTMQEVHAVLLTGGSAFGLAAADGVMRFLEERDIGYRTPWGRVPIVPAAVVFDLNIGLSTVRPGPGEGYAACAGGVDVCGPQGNVGAGAGATVGKWGGMERRMKGGLGHFSVEQDGVVVAAIAVVNAVGDVIDARGEVIAGARGENGRWLAEAVPGRTLQLIRGGPAELANTTLVAVLTNAQLSKVDANRLSQRGHDGMARAIKPAHTSYDGDIVFGLSSGGRAGVLFDTVAEMAADATAGAIRNAVRFAAGIEGAPGLLAG